VDGVPAELRIFGQVERANDRIILGEERVAAAFSVVEFSGQGETLANEVLLER